MQTKRQSLVESLSGTAIGYGVALCSQLVVFPMFGVQLRFRDNIAIGIIFTVISIVRGYAVRRLFNRLHTRRLQ